MRDEEYMEALEGLRLARNHFDIADDAYVDVAIAELNAAEVRLATILSIRRANGGPNGK